MTYQKYAVYMRVSTSDQTTENQKVDLKAYVLSRKLDVYDYYEDVITGKSKTRPDLDRLMRDARNGCFNHVLFWKVGRLGRNPLHMLQVVEEWDNLDINFTITTLGIDTSTPMGRFVFGLLAQVAELERQDGIERTNLSMRRIQKIIKEEGKYKTKDGKIITSLGRPKGKKDSKPRKRKGYFLKEKKRREKRPPHNLKEHSKEKQFL